GTKRYVVVDVPAEWAWTVAATASPWVARVDRGRDGVAVGGPQCVGAHIAAGRRSP
ncbi:hypothetical protein H7H98_02915, partial [Mycolicibacterium sphagni]|nr:hypothetical protein [Mycolicibacterium sphagni]